MKAFEVCLLERTCLNTKIFKKYNILEIDDPFKADVCITQSVMRFPELVNKTIYLSHEPFRSTKAKWCYKNFDKFKLVAAFSPDPLKSNQISFCEENIAHWPYVPSVSQNIECRNSTEIGNRGVFFAGNIIAPQTKLEDGSVNINHLRKLIGEHFLNEFPESIMMGIGWSGQTNKIKNWRRDKMNHIKNSNTDFVLALENTIMPDYITEKIWDGFYSKKVVLYLGDPNIEKKIPTNCFIDLRKYYDVEKNEVDLLGLSNRIKDVTQEEYDDMVKNSLQVVDKYKKIRNNLQDDFTKKIINHIIF